MKKYLINILAPPLSAITLPRFRIWLLSVNKKFFITLCHEFHMFIMHPPVRFTLSHMPYAFFKLYLLYQIFIGMPTFPRTSPLSKRSFHIILLLWIPSLIIFDTNPRLLILTLLATLVLAATNSRQNVIDNGLGKLIPATGFLIASLCVCSSLPTFSLSHLFYSALVPVLLLLVPRRHNNHANRPRTVPPRFGTTSLYSLLSFSWVSHLITTGYRRQLTSEDIPPLDPDIASINSARHLEDVHKAILKTSSDPSLLHIIARAFSFRFLIGVLTGILLHFIAFVPPIILRYILLSLHDSPSMYGVYLAVGLFATLICQSIISHQWFDVKSRIFVQLRGALNSKIYAKSTRLSVRSRAIYTSGRIQNLMAIDSFNVSRGTSDLSFLLVVLQQICTVLFLLKRLLGWIPTVATLTILIIFALAQGFLMIQAKHFREAAGDLTDERIKLVSEGIKGMKLVKLYAWEVPFVDKILGTRDEELAYIRKIAINQAFNSILVTSLPTLLVVTALAAYVVTGHVLDATVAFPVIVTFNIIRSPLISFPSTALAISRALASLSRLDKFLKAEELIPLQDSPNELTQEYLSMKDVDMAAFDASFAWNPSLIPKAYTLSSFSFDIPAGSLVAIVGPTGSGKSSLLSAFLNEISIISGKAGLRHNRSISFCDQIPFIQNATLRDNILFGKPFYPDHYWDTVRLCCLGPDLDMLPAQDYTEVGSRGVNLSGGQRARVSLARAVYALADICLLDDPLCAVDARVGKAIFRNCIVSALRGTTRLLTTNQIHFAASPHVDFVIVVKDGKLVEMASRESLLANKLSEFSRLVRAAVGAGTGGVVKTKVSEDNGKILDYAKNTNKPPAGHPSRKYHAEKATCKRDKKFRMNGELKEDHCSPKPWRLTKAETRESGKVRLHHYATFFRALGFWQRVVPFLIFALGNKVLTLSVDILFSKWSEQGGSENLVFQLATFVGLGLMSVLTTAGAVFSMASGSVRASRILHERLMLSVFGAPSEFFDSTPDGQIINRFHSDLDKMDSVIVPTMSAAIRLLLDLMFTFGIMIWASPWIIVAIIPVTGACIFIQEYYRKCSVDVRRLQAVAKSPLYCHFSETLDGIVTIRAFEGVSKGGLINSKLSDILCKTTYAIFSTNRWLGTRLDCASATLVFLATLLTVSSPALRLSVGKTGLVLSYVMQMLSTTLRFVRQFTLLESDMSCLERISEYSAPSFPREEKEGLDVLFFQHMQQKCHRTSTEPRDIHRPARGVSSSRHWPCTGRIDFENVEMRYRADLDSALKNISFVVNPGENVGIVGRTGAGKSSTINCLFRLQELVKGRILIDGTDIANLPLHDLRCSIGIIPQEPVCFSGTIWSNLDMCGEYSETEVQRALDECGLQSTTSRAITLLDKVTENGSNLSVGQRQLLCLGRVLLKESRILVLDEATSSVTNEIDEIIQRTLREKMKHCTILTIAHRLHTVMRSDKIMVMEKGEITEVGTPSELLSRKSRFSAMVDETGPATAAHLREIALVSGDR